MVEVVCNNCGKKFPRKRKYCDSCGQELAKQQEPESPTVKEKKDSEKEIKRQVVSPEDWEAHRKSVDGERPSDKRVSKNVYCPSCGKLHKTESRYCLFCGNDLEEVILKFKKKRLPIKYDVKKEKVKRDKLRSYVLVYSLLFSTMALVGVMANYIFGRDLHKIWAYILFGVFLIALVFVYILSYPLLPSRGGCYGTPSYSSTSCYCPSSRTCRGCDCGDCGGCEGACEGCGDCGDCT